MTKSDLIADIQSNLGAASRADAEKALGTVLASLRIKASKAIKFKSGAGLKEQL